MKSERAVRLALKRWERQALKEYDGDYRGLNVGVAACEAWLLALGWVLGFHSDPTTRYYHTKQHETVHKK